MRRDVLVVLATAVLGCGRVGFTPSAGPPSDAGLPVDAIACQTPDELQHANEGTAHSDGGVAVTWQSNPPTSGIHFDQWVRWNRSYAGQTIPRAYWVHNLEHGGVVFGYRCDVPCPDDVARLTAMLAALPLDTECSAIRHRAIVVEDRELPPDVRFSAAAWLYSWTSNCVDEASLTAFYTAHVARGPEVNCSDGSFP
jgi:hypothetical protein